MKPQTFRTTEYVWRHVVYHANCRDGMAAASVAWSRLGDDSQYYACHYGNPLPEAVFDGESILFVDFSPPESAIDKLGPWLAIDHHASVAPLAEKYPENFLFDLTESGASLTWKFFYPHQDLPKLLQYVKDRDLWLWNLPYSREVSTVLATFPNSFDYWANRFSYWPNPGDIETGKALYAAERAVFEAAASKGARYDLIIGDEVLPVVMVNCTTYISETCSTILKRREEVDVAVAFFFIGVDEVVLSFRSNPGFDLVPWVKKLGGGGHPNAAGAKIPFTKFQEIVRKAKNG